MMMHRTRTIAWVGLVAAVTFLLSGLGGCDTIGDDLSHLTNGFNQTTPAEAARLMLDQRDPENRRKGTILISNSTFGGAPVYVRAYRDMVENEQNPLVLAASVRALARYGQPDDAPAIAVHLQHENKLVRWEAAKGLQRIHNPEVVPDLLRCMSDVEGGADERVAAAVALGQYPEDRVFQGLLTALDARPLALNMAAEDALQTLTGQSLGREPADWLAWYSAAGASTRFAADSNYMYPTYERDPSFWEQLAFWNTPIREHSAIPAGLDDPGRRSTYEDDDEDPDQPPTS